MALETIKPAIAAASLLPVLHANATYTLAADEACRVTKSFPFALPEIR